MRNVANTDTYSPCHRTARNFLLRLTLSKGQRHSFENLQREDLDALKKAINTVTNGHVELDVKDVSLKGWNWGKADVQGMFMSLQAARCHSHSTYQPTT